MYFFSKCGIKQPRNLKPLKYKSFLFSDLYIYSFCYDKDLLCNHGVIKLHDIIQSKKKKKIWLRSFSRKNELFSIDKNFLAKFLPEAIIREDWCQNFLHFFHPPKSFCTRKFQPLNYAQESSPNFTSKIKIKQYDLRVNRIQLIRLNSLNIKSEI